MATPKTYSIDPNEIGTFLGDLSKKDWENDIRDPLSTFKTSVTDQLKLGDDAQKVLTDGTEIYVNSEGATKQIDHTTPNTEMVELREGFGWDTMDGISGVDRIIDGVGGQKEYSNPRYKYDLKELHELDLNKRDHVDMAQKYLYQCADVEREYIWAHKLLRKSAVYSQNLAQHYKYSIAVIEELLKKLKIAGGPQIKLVKSVLKDAKKMAEDAAKISNGLDVATQHLGTNYNQTPFSPGNPTLSDKITKDPILSGGGIVVKEESTTNQSSKPVLYLLKPSQEKEKSTKEVKEVNSLMKAMNSFEKKYPLVKSEKKTKRKTKKKLRKVKTQKRKSKRKTK